MREYIQNQKVIEFKEPDLSATYSYEDYLQWDDWDEWIEIIRGRIFKMGAAPSRMHQTIGGNLHLYIRTFLKGNPCQVFMAPFDVRFPLNGSENRNIRNVVQPDLCVVCDPSKLDAKGCIGSPDWIIEILSPSNLEKDLKLKYDLYEEAGVREYWIVYPADKTIHAYVLENQKFSIKNGPYCGQENISPYIFPALSISMKDIFENT
jgi:Uma2 family endonuclease